MQPDLEYLIWLYSIGVEEFLNEVPVNQFGEEHQDNFIKVEPQNCWILKSRFIKYLNVSKEEEIQKFYFDEIFLLS